MACQDNLTFMRRLPNESMQLIVTSPPYNIGKSYEAKSSLDAYVEMQAESIAECVRLLHSARLAVLASRESCAEGRDISRSTRCSTRYSESMASSFAIASCGISSTACIARNGSPAATRPSCGSPSRTTTSSISIQSGFPPNIRARNTSRDPRPGSFRAIRLAKIRATYGYFPNVKNNHVEKTIHPCQFPIELVERLVLSLTEPRRRGIRPLYGRGLRVIAALKHGRIGYGCDIVKEYVDIAWHRVGALHAGSLRTRPMDRPVYDPAKPYGGQREFRQLDRQQALFFHAGELDTNL